MPFTFGSGGLDSEGNEIYTTADLQKKIEDNVTRQQSLDIGSFVADKTLSAQFTIKKSKGRIKNPRHKVPPRYWNLNLLRKIGTNMN